MIPKVKNCQDSDQIQERYRWGFLQTGSQSARRDVMDIYCNTGFLNLVAVP